MYDSVTGAAIPTSATIVAGYADGPYGPNDPYGSGWSAAAWARYPRAEHVTITVEGTPGARAADCESGAMTPQATALWARNEVNAGRRPTVYADAWDWANEVDQALAGRGLQRGRDVDGWVARIGPATIPNGFVACQYAQDIPGLNGSRIDVSVTNGIWPSIAPPAPAPAPPLTGIEKPISGRFGMLSAPIVAVVRTNSGNGYTLVGADGGTFNYGDAPYLGSLAGTKLAAPIVDAVRTPDGNGLVLVGTDGGVFCFGTAQFFGSMGGKKLDAPVVSIAIAPAGNGYWMTGADGGVFAFGPGAPFEGSAA